MPQILLEFKKHVTIQCWSDIVRIWLLMTNGGVWLDASVIVDFNNIDPIDYLKNNRSGMMFYQKIENDKLVLDNWMMVTEGNLTFFKTWFKMFMTIVYNGNDIFSAKPYLLNLCPTVHDNIDENETYLTMHQASRLALEVTPLPDYLLMPGFAGPLGWITDNLGMAEWMNCVINKSYKIQGGALKMIGLSRKIACQWEKDTQKDFVELFSMPGKTIDYLIVVIGTKGDLLPSRALNRKLQSLGLEGKLINCTNLPLNDGETKVDLHNDILLLSGATNLSNLDEKLDLVKNMFIRLTETLTNVKSKYMFANYSIPTMMQIARLTGSMPINFTAMPTYELDDNATYLTMDKNQEQSVNIAVDSLTYKVAKDLNVTWNADGVVNGKRSLMQIMPTEPYMIQEDRLQTNKFCIGNIIDGSVFDCVDAKIVINQLHANDKIDVVNLGPSMDGTMLEKLKKSISTNRQRAEVVIVVGKQLKHLTKNRQSRIDHTIKTYYRACKYVESINMLQLKDRVVTVYCHGGVNTMSDALAINARVISLGDKVDQTYWSTTMHNKWTKTNLTDLLGKLFVMPKPPSVKTFKQLMQNNGFNLKPRVRQVYTGESEIIFSPLMADDCVKLCLEQWLKTNNQEWTTLARLKLKRLMTKQELIETVISLQQNLILIENGYADHWNWFNVKADPICIALTKQSNLLHANLVKWTSHSLIANDIAPRPSINLKYNLLNSLTGNNNSDTIELHKVISGGSLINAFKLMDSVNNITYTTNTKKLTHRMERVKNAIVSCKVNLIDNSIALIESNQLISGKLYGYINGDKCGYALIYIGLDDKTYSITSKSLETTDIIFLDLGCRMFEMNQIVSRPEISTNFKPLNVQTLQRIQTELIEVKVDRTLAKLGDENVILSEFDNKQHDKYNEKSILEQANNIYWLGNVPNDREIELLNDTYNNKLRYIYSMGRVQCRLDTSNVAEKFLARSLANDRMHAYTISRGVTIDAVLLDDDWTDLNNAIEKLTSEEFKADKKPIRKTKDEWLQLLAIPNELWEEWSSRCTTQHNDYFHSVILTSYDGMPGRGDFDQLMSDGLIYCGRTCSFSLNTMCWFIKPRKGGKNEIELNEEKINLGNSRDWWRKIGTEPQILKDLTPNPLVDTFTDTTEFLNDSKWGSNLKLLSLFESDAIADEDIDFDLNMQGLDNKLLPELTPHEIQNLWINTDLSMDLRQYAPINTGVVRSKENPDKIRDTHKVLMNNPYPMESRPVLTKWTFEEHRSITGRLFSKIKYRKPEKTMSTKKRLNKFIDCYFEKGFVPYQESHQILEVDAYETMLWISKRKDGLKIAQELNNLLSDELGLMPLNAINIHLKLESLLKAKPIMHWGEHQARAIYWQRKAIAAISSPIFLKIKSRLKNSLKAKYVYADGLTPIELTKKTRQATNTNWFFENDLSKQDRQTDRYLIDVEMEIYLLLGASSSVIKWWRTMHETWKFRARWNKGYAKEMRLTGQSSTSLGNLITNMQVHNDFLNQNDEFVNLVLFLGDDLLALLTDKVDISELNKTTKHMHNMQSTAYINDTCGLFCCMVGYKNSHGGVDIGPDYVRLRHRFEVTNGVSEATDDNIIARCQSYACMLGKTAEMIKLRRRKNWPIPLVNWYTSEGLIPAIMERYGLTEYEVMMNYDLLCSYLNQPEIIDVVFSTYTNVKVY